MKLAAFFLLALLNCACVSSASPAGASDSSLQASVAPTAQSTASSSSESHTTMTTERQILVAASSPLPFSPAVRAGSLVFISGQLGLTPGTQTLVSGGIEAETNATLTNMRTVLEQAGLTLADVVKCTVFLADIKDFAAMNRVYSEFFPKEPPARSTVGVAQLIYGARVEIECIAAAKAK